MRTNLERNLLASATLVVWLTASPLAHAADNYVIQGSTWSDPNNWSLHSPPGTDDHALLTLSSSGDLTFLFDSNCTPPGLGGLTVDNPGGGSMVLSVPANSLIATNGYIGKTGQGVIRQTGGVTAMTNLTLGDAAGSSGRYELSLGQLSAGALTVGKGGSGTFIQTGGASFADGLVVGQSSGSSGRYELGGGTLAVDRLSLADGGTGTLAIGGSAVLDVISSIEVGTGGGQGTVEQTGGTVTVHHRSVTLDTGTWNLSGGTYTMLAEPLHVSNGAFNVSGTGRFSGTSVNLKGYGSAAGNFNQSGGTVTIGEQLTIGSAEAAGAPRYALSNGTLTAAKVQVGGEGAGLFQQTGGQLAVTNLSVAADGRYEYGGGSLSIANTWDNAGQFDFLGGSATVTAGPGAAVNLSVGQILNSTHATLDVLGTDSLVIFASGFDPDTQFASFTNQGTTHHAGSTLTVAAGRTVKLVGDFNDHAVVAGTLTNQGQPVNLNNGVEVSGTGVVNLGVGILTVQDTVSNISGGQVTAHSGFIGNTGNAGFVQTGGTVTLSLLSLGESAGSEGRYELSQGQLGAGAFYVGKGGSGTFIQTGGASFADGLVVGQSSGSSGRYELGGGTLAVDRLSLADGGTGTLVIGGSAVLDVTSSIEVGTGGGEGTVEQTGGTVTVHRRSVNLGTGTWNLSGGTYTMLAEPLHVSNGAFNVSGTGRFSGTSVNLKGYGSAAGNFNQSGGTVTIGEQLTIGSAEAAGAPRYALSNGTLTAAKVQVGGEGAGLFQQTGGQLAVTNLSVAADGRFEHSGGSLSATSLTNDGQFTSSSGGISASTFINTGAMMLSGDGVRTIDGDVTNAGTIAVHAAVVFDGVLTNTGTLDTDAVALAFDSLVCGSIGYVRSAAGAVFSVTGDFINQSAAADSWDTTGAGLQLVGGEAHLLALAGAALGADGYRHNFAWQSLVLGPGGSMVLQDGNSTPGAALYVGRFILTDGLSQIDRVHGHGFDIYYDSLQPDNAYLGGQIHDLTDGGQLIPHPIPEPTVIGIFLAFLGSMSVLLSRRRGCARSNSILDFSLPVCGGPRGVFSAPGTRAL